MIKNTSGLALASLALAATLSAAVPARAQVAGAASADVKLRIDGQITALQDDLKAAESLLGEMKQSAAERWKEFEAGVSAATARLRKSIDTAVG